MTPKISRMCSSHGIAGPRVAVSHLLYFALTPGYKGKEQPIVRTSLGSQKRERQKVLADGQELAHKPSTWKSCLSLLSISLVKTNHVMTSELNRMGTNNPPLPQAGVPKVTWSGHSHSKWQSGDATKFVSDLFLPQCPLLSLARCLAPSGHPVNIFLNELKELKINELLDNHGDAILPRFYFSNVN